MQTITTRTQLASYYGVNARTLSRWLEAAKIELPSGHIPPLKLEEIFQKLGHPKQVKLVN